MWTTNWATGAYLADLPFGEFSFSSSINQAGRAQLEIQANDPRVQGLDLIASTQRNQVCLWIEYNGTLVWGGLVTQRRYTRSSGMLEVTANTFSSYFSNRWQAKDYTYTWMAPADPMTIATTVVNDAMDVQNSLLDGSGSGLGVPFEVVKFGQTPLRNWVTMSYPSIQLQSLSMIISTLTQMGYTVGFDYLDVVVPGDPPGAQWWIANPYIGRPPPTPLVIDIGQTVDTVVSEDGTKQANAVVEMSTSAGSVMVFGQWPPAQIDYPLLQRIEMHPDVNSTPNVQLVLDAMAQTDLVLTAFGGDVVSVTLPVEGASVELGGFSVGDAMRLDYSPTDEPYKTPDPRFPRGLSSWWRPVTVAVTVPTHGLATMKLTLNVLPADRPTESGLSASGVPDLVPLVSGTTVSPSPPFQPGTQLA